MPKSSFLLHSHNKIHFVEFSLARYKSIAVYPNNSAIDYNLVGEGFKGDQITGGGALECHTDDTTCCRGIDNPPNGTGRGEWYYPDGTVVPPYGEHNFYITRDHMVIRLNYIVNPYDRRASGLFKCVIPGARGSIIRKIELTRHVTKGKVRVLYIPLQVYLVHH